MVTTSDIAKHLRISPEEADSTLLHLYEGAAVEYVNAFTGVDWHAEVEVPFAISAAVLLLMGDLYENREASTPLSLKENPAVSRLLWPFRRFA